MAEIAPFRGVLYDFDKADASAVLAPPYDVIDEAGRADLAAKDPKNCIRLILPEDAGGRDSEGKYANAASIFEGWLADGTLVRDQRPAIYRYHQIFTIAGLGDNPVTRRGFIAAVRLHRFDEGVILRHELTLKGPKIDRLNLMKATGAHLSQIFTLYSDPAGETDRAFERIEKTEPVLDGVTDDGTRHRLWRVDDREVIGQVARVIASRKLYIADGHHRYETMVAFRDHMREQAGGELDRDSAGEFGTLFLANMDDPGLVVLPTHRLVHGVDGFDSAALLEKVAAFFTVRTIEGGAAAAASIRRLLADAGSSGPSVAAVFPGSDDAHVLTLRPDFDPAAAGLELPAAVRSLDVSLLHGVVFEQILGITKEAQEAKTNLRYYKDTAKALAERGEGQALFVMNATPVQQVRAVSDAGEVMPQKSTFFYPKIASGVLFNKIDPSESLT
jgi:uncharacterized protein (DUF1015 family)